MQSQPEVYQAEKAAGITIVLLMGLGIVQVILGETIAKSVALTANGIDCIGDGFVSFIVWAGLRVVKRDPDSKFHYGYYKIENLASVAAAVVMIVLAGYISYRAYMQFVNPHEILVPILGAVIALIAALVAWGIGVHKYIKGRKLGLSSLKLDAVNTIKDGTASFLAVAALVLSARGYPVADAVAGFIIAAIIVSIGFATIKEASYVLVDACDTECFDKRQVIQMMVEEIPKVKSAHVVRLRRSGPVLQGEIEIEVSPYMSVKEAHVLRTHIKKKVQDQFPDVEWLTVVVVPYK
ncbi:MAG: cation diffusion facilitator family transporter [Candidatus Methanofastidiosia archaeon]|jgi:cation diffusion facilitator family transporter